MLPIFPKFDHLDSMKHTEMTQSTPFETHHDRNTAPRCQRERLLIFLLSRYTLPQSSVGMLHFSVYANVPPPASSPLGCGLCGEDQQPGVTCVCMDVGRVRDKALGFKLEGVNYSQAEWSTFVERQSSLAKSQCVAYTRSPSLQPVERPNQEIRRRSVEPATTVQACRIMKNRWQCECYARCSASKLARVFRRQKQGAAGFSTPRPKKLHSICIG